MRKSDNKILSEEEYNSIVDKNNYQKNEKEVLYIRKSDGVAFSEDEYNRKKSDYKKKTVYEYTRISDGTIVSENEYREITKKSAYKITVGHNHG